MLECQTIINLIIQLFYIWIAVVIMYISSITITKATGGSGYTSAPSIVVLPAAGDLGWNVSATYSAGAVTGVTMVNNGSGYTLPTINKNKWRWKPLSNNRIHFFKWRLWLYITADNNNKWRRWFWIFSSCSNRKCSHFVNFHNYIGRL